MRLIDADALFESLPNASSENEKISRNRAIADMAILVCDAPTIDAEPVRHARWDKSKGYIYAVRYTCSYCDWMLASDEGSPQELGMRYCPYCGAAMDEDADHAAD